MSALKYDSPELLRDARLCCISSHYLELFSCSSPNGNSNVINTKSLIHNFYYMVFSPPLGRKIKSKSSVFHFQLSHWLADFQLSQKPPEAVSLPPSLFLSFLKPSLLLSCWASYLLSAPPDPDFTLFYVWLVLTHQQALLPSGFRLGSVCGWKARRVSGWGIFFLTPSTVCLDW